MKNKTFKLLSTLQVKESKIMYFLVSVDDIIITRSSISLIQNVTATTISLKHLGQLHCFPGLEVKHLPNQYVLMAQRKYEIFIKVKLLKFNPFLLLWSQTANYLNLLFIFSHISVIGALHYATLTRLEISFAIKRIS